jgi:hypothetical protein
MAPITVSSSQSGPRLTVNDWVKDPARIPAYIISLADQGFLADAIFRPGGTTPSGVVRYEETTPIYADSDLPLRAEGAEVPVIGGSRGVPNVAYTKEYAGRVLVTDEQRRRNTINVLSDTMTQVSNTMIKMWDDMAVATCLNNANIQSQAASAVWSTGTTDIRGDILKAAEKIEGVQDAQGSEMGYAADTLVVNRATKFDIITSDQFNKVYEGGNIADQHLKYTGLLPRKIMDYDVLFSPRVPSGVAILMQRNKCGFIVDEVPLQGFPLDEDRNRLSWSSIVRRSSAMALDNPKTVCKITGVV